MSYTKTVWTDRQVQYPNRYKDQNNTVYTFTRDEGTITDAGVLVNATNLNKMETGIETLDLRLSNDEIYVTATAGSNGDFYVTLADTTLATNRVIRINFPAATTATANARLSINNGTNYTNIKLLRGNTTIPASLVQNQKLQLFYNGTNWIVDSSLVASHTLTSNGRPITISNLDIVNDGGVYDIVFQGRTTGATDGVTLQLNSVTTGYHYVRFIAEGTRTSSGALTPTAQYSHNANIFQPGATDVNSDAIITSTISLSNSYATISSTSGTVNNARQEIYFMAGQNTNTITNITDITVSTYVNNFVAGATVKIFKRL